MYNEEKYLDSEKLLDEVFQSSPEYNLSVGFADKMAEKLGRKLALEQLFQEFLIYLGSIAGMAAVVVGISLIWFPEYWIKGTNLISSNIPIVTGVGVILVFILFADRFLLRYFLYRSSGKIT